MPYIQYWSLAAISGYGYAIYAESEVIQWSLQNVLPKTTNWSDTAYIQYAYPYPLPN